MCTCGIRAARLNLQNLEHGSPKETINLPVRCGAHQTPRSMSLASSPGCHTICPAKKRKLISPSLPASTSRLAGPSPAQHATTS